MAFVEIVGVGISIAALSVATYSTIKRRRIERRLDRKDELRELSLTLSNIEEKATEFHNVLSDYSAHHDLPAHLYSASRELLAMEHALEEHPAIVYEVRLKGNEEDQAMEEPKDGLRHIKDGNRLKCLISVGETNDDYSGRFGGSIGHIFNISNDFYEAVELESGQRELLREFDPEIIGRLEDRIDEIHQSIFGKLIESSDIKHIPVDQYQDAAEIEQDIFETAYYYDGIEEDLDELESLINEIDDLRKSILQTSYA